MIEYICMCTTYAEANGGKNVHGTGVRGVIKCCVLGLKTGSSKRESQALSIIEP